MTLPYLSYGGSSIVSVSILSGIILNLTKRKLIKYNVEKKMISTQDLEDIEASYTLYEHLKDNFDVFFRFKRKKIF